MKNGKILKVVNTEQEVRYTLGASLIQLHAMPVISQIQIPIHPYPWLHVAIVAAEVNRLREEARRLCRERDARAVGDRVERMELLWRLACAAEAEGNVGDAVRCVAELNRMDGAYEPERVQVAAVAFSFEGLMDGLAGGGAGV